MNWSRLSGYSAECHVSAKSHEGVVFSVASPPSTPRIWLVIPALFWAVEPQNGSGNIFGLAEATQGGQFQRNLGAPWVPDSLGEVCLHQTRSDSVHADLFCRVSSGRGADQARILANPTTSKMKR